MESRSKWCKSRTVIRSTHHHTKCTKANVKIVNLTKRQRKRKEKCNELSSNLVYVCIWEIEARRKTNATGRKKMKMAQRQMCAIYECTMSTTFFFSLVHSMAMCPKYTTYTSTLFFPPNLKPFFVGASAPCNRISVCINCNEMKSKTWFTIFHCCTTALCSQTLMNLPHYQVRRIKDKILR